MKRITATEPVLVLPRWTLFGTKSDPPHRQTVLAACTKKNKWGTLQRFAVATNHPKTRWWISAVYVTGSADGSADGWFRASNTLTTTSRKKAEQWIAAVSAGRVEIAEDRS